MEGLRPRCRSYSFGVRGSVLCTVCRSIRHPHVMKMCDKQWVLFCLSLFALSTAAFFMWGHGVTVGVWLFLLQPLLFLSLKVFACFAQEWITECYKQRKLVEIETYLMHAGKPWKRQSVSRESSQGHLSLSLSLLLTPSHPVPKHTLFVCYRRTGLIKLNIVNDTYS